MELCPPIYTWSSNRFVVTKFLSFHWQQKVTKTTKFLCFFLHFKPIVITAFDFRLKSVFLVLQSLEPVRSLQGTEDIAKKTWGVWWSLAMHLLGLAYFFLASFGDRIGDLFYFSYVFIAYYMMCWCSGYQIPWLFCLSSSTY